MYMIIGSGIVFLFGIISEFLLWTSNNAAIFMNIIPLAGMSLAVILLHEHLGWQEIVGALWIVLGVYITTYQRR